MKTLKRILVVAAIVCLVAGAACAETPEEREAKAAECLMDGVVPVTWEPDKDHLIITGDEAKTLYDRIESGDYLSMEELKANHVVAQIDSLSAYYKALYGNTLEINTPERDALRKEIRDKFLAYGSARTKKINPETGKHKIAYDGPLNRDYKMILALGLPASGKSTNLAEPISEEIGAFILDCDEVKKLIPEYQESHGCAADAVHFESFAIMDDAMQEFLTGSMKGVNVIIPIVASDFDELMESYIKPFEEAGYNVKAVFRPAKPNEAACRCVSRELRNGRIINSAVAFGFGDGPEEVFNKLSEMTNAWGEPYVDPADETEEELAPAA
ncbi:MAG: zeta toxin family protein [Clostridia bacterium]|nr:zeta toxin family protein [Clostridia bacterium]